MWKTLILRVIQTLEIVLMMFFAAFCSYLKNLPEAKIKRVQSIALTKEVSQKPSIDFVLWFSLKKSILVKYSKLRKEIYKMYGSSI